MLKQSFFKKNRKGLFEFMQKNSVFFLQSKDILMKGDSEFFDFPDNNIFYFSGINQADTKMILFVDSNLIFSEYLFIQNRDEKREMWEGKKLSIKEAKKISGFKNVFYESEFEKISSEIFSKANLLYYFKDEKITLLSKSEYDLNIEKIKKKNKLNLENFYGKIAKLRQRKSSDEISIIKEAMKISEKSFLDVMKNIRYFRNEMQVEAKITYNYVSYGAKHSYHPIVAGGICACTLHYITNNQKLRKGDLLLIDSGAELYNYKTDITRVFPISGKFSKRQTQVYQAVLDVQKKAISMLKPGLERMKWEMSVYELISEKLIELGVLSKSEYEKDKKSARKYYPHSTGHFLGLDTHDIGDWNTVFSEGDVYTVEPGIYIEKERLGIRIEDNVLITKNGCEVLSKRIPKEIKEIESLCSL